MDWTECRIVESVPGKVSGVPVLVGTRIPAAAVIENVDAFVEIDGMSLDQAIAATAECFPSAGVPRIAALLEYRSNYDLRRNLQPQS